MPTAAEIAEHLDELLSARGFPDYAPALNGLQLASRREVRRVAAAVDFSRRTVDGAIAAGADFLIVHHGMFWGGLRPITGQLYDRLAPLFAQDVAVYASHLPLDAHPTLGNAALLARELGLAPAGGFARYQTVAVGVQGEADVETATLVARASAFARAHGGGVRASELAPGRVTRRWAICTGAGASAETLQEAAGGGIDTLIVGEGPHWTAVDAPERGLALIYAGHYATETLGVRALAEHVSTRYGVPWTFIEAPTGL